MSEGVHCTSPFALWVKGKEKGREINFSIPFEFLEAQRREGGFAGYATQGGKRVKGMNLAPEDGIFLSINSLCVRC